MNETKEKLLIEAHSMYFKLMLGNHPLESMNQYVVDDVMGYGTTLEEKVFGIDSLINLGKIQREQSEGLDIRFTVNPVFKKITHNEDTAIFVDEILITIPIENDTHELHVRISTILEYFEDKWKVIHWHASAPVATEGDTWHKDEWKRKNDELQKLVNEKTAALHKSLEELKATQSQLIQSEKMASLGELTAGIAHEIQNPLNFINNFSDVNKELLMEMNDEIDKENFDEVKILSKDVIENEQKINHHGKRADAIVKGMLQHSRSSNGQKEPTDINALADEYLRLAYHGLRAKEKNFNATLVSDFDQRIGSISIIPQDIGRVVLNLITNAFYAVKEKSLQANASGETKYEPTVWLNTKKEGDQIFISVKDNGNGIPQKTVDKIFQPFFTTKPTGEGTGLGLSISYDIIKAHGGEITINTKENEGTTFTIVLRAYNDSI
jgi:signal transduction histidine kinase